MAIELPDVEQEWTANVAPYIEAMAELIDSVKAARDESLAAIEEIQAGIDHLDGKTILITVDTVGAGGETGAAAAAGEAAAQAAAYHEAGDAAAEAQRRKPQQVPPRRRRPRPPLPGLTTRLPPTSGSRPP